MRWKCAIFAGVLGLGTGAMFPWMALPQCWLIVFIAPGNFVILGVSHLIPITAPYDSILGSLMNGLFYALIGALMAERRWRTRLHEDKTKASEM